ncbi:MAG: GNAT family N-acetyltransferase [Actinomycetia bacterium]|nr:GNAT family N-acetyltransferase [Actinomycetes bacterium]
MRQTSTSAGSDGETNGAGRSVLRPLERSDVPELARLVRLNRAFLAQSGPERVDEDFTDEGQARAVERSLQAAENDSKLSMVIVDVSNNIVGTLNINSIIRGAFQSGSLGYWVSEDRNGQGVASAAVAAAKRVAREQLGLHRLQAETLVDNTASQRVLLKNGFVQYGQAADYLKIAGRWQEHRLFQAILPEVEVR